MTGKAGTAENSTARRSPMDSGARWLVVGVLALTGSAHAQCQPVWSTLEGGVFGGPAAPLYADLGSLAVSDPDGPGPMLPMLVVGGGFVRAGSVESYQMAAWDGWAWHAIGMETMPLAADIHTLEPIPLGVSGGPPGGLYVGGRFRAVASIPVSEMVRRRDGMWEALAEWEAIVLDSSDVFVLHAPQPALPFGGTLHVGGAFEVGGASPGEHLAHWDGAHWTSHGDVFGPSSQPQFPNVGAIVVFDDDGPGPRPPGLYVSGRFLSIAGQPTRNIARFDGTNWEPIPDVGGSPLLGGMGSLCVFDEDGNGPGLPALFGSGVQFNGPADNIGRWDGQQWSSVGGGLDGGSVGCFFVHDEDGDGPGLPALFVGGRFTQAGGVPVSRLARWNGSTWGSVGGGVSGLGASSLRVSTMAFFDEDGPGPNPGGLYVGGFFTHAGGIPSNAIARWGCPLAPQCYANCNGDMTPLGAARLDVNDYICFQTKFALGDPYADCDGNGVRNVNDYICFQTKFALGC